MNQPEHRRLTILGGGPIAIETALYSRTLGFSTTLLEQGRLGRHLLQWGHLRLFTPWAMNTSPLGRRRLRVTGQAPPPRPDDSCPTGEELLDTYLIPLSHLPEMKGVVRENTRVLAVGKADLWKTDAPGSAARGDAPFRILFRHQDMETTLESDIVIDATGVYGRPNPLGIGGIPVPGEQAVRSHIKTGLPRWPTAEIQGKDVMVVGSGMSAATSLVALASMEPASVVWVTMHDRIPSVPDDPLPQRVALTQQANEFVQSRQVESLTKYGITALRAEKGRVTAELASRAGNRATRVVDLILNQTGFRPDMAILRELQIHTCFASEGPMKLAAALLDDSGSDCLEQVSHGSDTLINPEPNCFVIGHKSYGRNPNFLLRVGHDQIRDVFRIITGDSALDLYSSHKVAFS